MFHKVLVGIDGHAGGLDAAALARRLVAPDGELVLAYVDVTYSIAAKGDGGAYSRVLHADAQAVLERASAQTGIQSHVAHDATSVGQGLQELAESESADLVVVGATRRGPAARILIGDDTRGTLKAVHGAVAVAPAGYAEKSSALNRIGVAYDGSTESRAAATVARDLSIVLKAELAAIEVLDVPMYLIYSGKNREGGPSGNTLDEAAKEITALGDFEPRVRFGYVKDQLVSASGTLDLLVMGSRSVGLVRRLLSGSTSLDLARSAHCAILVLTETACASYHADHLLREQSPTVPSGDNYRATMRLRADSATPTRP
jgi:nucleotide-binding universal stress UspA family protein